MRRALRERAFLRDAAQAYAYVARRSDAAADRLLDELDRMVVLLAENPGVGAQRPELGEGVRSFPLRRYKYLIFYRYDEAVLRLLRFLHGARDIAVAWSGGEPTDEDAPGG
ncbi:MAG: type II toxin-antitoxin system RelE/ParE family toxin [Hyphomonadaceae bacterium]|nr:type II toxin-antitoxin system RelE/ParE family toxin [Hyphomonadaceae bacterium]